MCLFLSIEPFFMKLYQVSIAFAPNFWIKMDHFKRITIETVFCYFIQKIHVLETRIFKRHNWIHLNMSNANVAKRMKTYVHRLTECNVGKCVTASFLFQTVSDAFIILHSHINNKIEKQQPTRQLFTAFSSM